jgi:hypothetical protein
MMTEDRAWEALEKKINSSKHGDIIEVDKDAMEAYIKATKDAVESAHETSLAESRLHEDELTYDEVVARDNAIEPSHYTDMAISPLEFIEANQDVLTWCTSNVIKYVGRHMRKNGLEDLKKAQWYLNHEIERLEKDNK